MHPSDSTAASSRLFYALFLIGTLLTSVLLSNNGYAQSMPLQCTTDPVCSAGAACPDASYCTFGNCCYRGWDPSRQTGCHTNFDYLHYHNYAVNWHQWGLNVAPLWGLTPSNLPPLKKDITNSSSPMVTGEVRHFGGSEAFLERALQNDIVDLTSLGTMLQAVDFELPFGSATFRHVRTYSEEHLRNGFPLRDETYLGEMNQWNGREGELGAFWDWNGQNWMMGENPIFMLDADSFWNLDEPRKAYFIPDAHHSIPFEFNQSLGRYVAPPGFDAVMDFSSDGQLDSTGNWVQRPSQVYIYLHRRSVKYTIEMKYGWVPEELKVPHRNDYQNWPFYPSCYWDGDTCIVPICYDPATNQRLCGPGVPSLGIVRRIEDRFGNRIEMEYVDDDDPTCSPTAELYIFEPLEYRNNCSAKCNQRGQLKAVKLYAAGESTAIWTILYTYREFGYYCQRFNDESGEHNVCDASPACDDPCSLSNGQCGWDQDALNANWQHENYMQWMRRHRPHALHSIHVFSGNISTATLGDLTLPFPQFCTAQSISELEDLTHPQIQALGDTWRIKVSYVYDEFTSELYHPFYPASVVRKCPSDCLYSGGAMNLHLGGGANEARSMNNYVSWGRGYHLLKASVTRRMNQGSVSPSQTLQTMYRYSGGGGGPAPHMSGIIEDQQISNILAANAGMHANDLMAIADDEDVFIRDQQTGENIEKPLGELIPLRFTYQAFSREQLGDLMDWAGILDDGNFFYHAAGGLESSNLTGPGWQYTLDDRRGGPSDGTYRFMTVVRYPNLSESCDEQTYPLIQFGPEGVGSRVIQASQTKYPFRYRTKWGYYCNNNVTADKLYKRIHGASPDAPVKPFYYTVVDKVREHKSGRTEPVAYQVFPARGIAERRIVELMANGTVVRDRQWSFSEDGSGSLESQLGFSESTFRDCRGRKIEVRTTGWDSPENSNREQQGLIFTYEYPDPACPSRDPTTGSCVCPNTPYPPEPPPGEVSAEKMKQGTDGTEYYIRSFERHPERPELISREVQYRTPATSTSTSDVQEILYQYEFQNPSDVLSSAIIQKETVSSAVPFDAQGNTAQKVILERYDERGSLQWEAHGSIDDSGNPLEMFVDYHHFNEQGQVTFEVVDATPGGQVPSFPSGFLRVSPLPALSYLTSYEYDPVFGLTRVVQPDGMEQRFVYRQEPDNQLTQYIFNDLEPAGGGSYRALSPGKIVTNKGEKLEQSMAVEFEGTFQPSDSVPYEIIEVAVPQYDEFGRLNGLARGDPNGNQTISATIKLNMFGKVERQAEADGTIMRITYDELGRQKRFYRGTRDMHDYWGTATIPDPFPGPCDEIPSDDNMVLYAQQYYGTGVTDAGQLIRIRKYRSVPDNQYFEVIPEDLCPNVPQPPDNNENNIGYVSDLAYDLRMNNVWQGFRDVNGDLLKIKVTLRDHLGRERFMAQYGPAGISADQARALNDQVISQGEQFNAATLLATPDLLGLEEMRYNAMGMRSEARSYEIGQNNASNYVRTASYYTHHKEPVLVQPVNGPEMRVTYDSLGRATRRSSWAGNREVSRLESTYTISGKPVRTVSWDRKPTMLESGSAGLDNSNSIKSYSYAWFDGAGRMVAQARFGTNSPDNKYSSGPEPLPTNIEQLRTLSPAQLNADRTVIGCDHRKFEAQGAGAEVTCFAFDDKGNQTAIFSPNANANASVVTRTLFDSLGRMVLKVQNNDATQASERQVTAYRYDNASGHLTAIAAVLPSHGGGVTVSNPTINWSATDGSLQITEIRYGADVLDEGGAAVSRNNSWIQSVNYPRSSDGQPSEQDKFEFKYNFEGSVAQRIDPRGAVIGYLYDELQQRTEAVFNDASVFPNGQADIPMNRTTSISYDYTADGRYRRVTAYNPNGDILTQNEFSYDGRRNLTAERFARGGALNAQSARVDYQRQFLNAAQGNSDRLRVLRYPANLGSSNSRHTVTFNYGPSNSAAAQLGLLTSIRDNYFGEVARYSYSGRGINTYERLGNGIELSLQQSGADTGLDRFARLASMSFKLGTSELHRYDYSYTRSGEIAATRVMQAFGHTNDRSFLYQYDNLKRLVVAHRGTLNQAGTAIAGGSPNVRTSWSLDNVGNWSGGTAASGSVIVEPLAGAPDAAETIHHATSANNQISQVTYNGVQVENVISDLAGNVLYDGDYVYRYDALGRLIEVRLPGTAVISPTGAITSGSLGNLIAGYVYDGLGRLAQRFNPQATEDYLYDGARRLQEVMTSSGNRRVEREYIYGPADVDDYIAQVIYNRSLGQSSMDSTYESAQHLELPVDEGTMRASPDIDSIDQQSAPADQINPILPSRVNARIEYYLQDRNFNVVGLASAIGQILRQYTYTPYGQLAAEERGGLASKNKVGHQGLIFDSFLADRDFKFRSTTQDQGPGLYYNRNRFYSSKLGRFLQRDPNALAQPIYSAISFHGSGQGTLFSNLDPIKHYNSGMNLYQYEGSNPISGRDPLGLEDPFAEVDAVLGEIYGQRAAAAAAVTSFIGMSFNVAAVLGSFAFSLVPGSDAIILGMKLAQGKDITMEDIMFAGLSIGGGAILAKALGSFVKMMKTYAQRSGRIATAFGKIITGCLVDRSFAAGTLVLMADMSFVPIEQIKIGDMVLCYDEKSQTSACEVKNVFSREATNLLDITVISTDSVTRLTTTPDHEFYSPSDEAFMPLMTLSDGSPLYSPYQSVWLGGRSIGQGPQIVYNLEVDRTHNYFVTPLAVLVHNKCLVTPDTLAGWDELYELAMKRGAVDFDLAKNSTKIMTSTGMEVEMYIVKFKDKTGKVIGEAHPPHSPVSGNQEWHEYLHFHDKTTGKVEKFGEGYGSFEGFMKSLGFE